MKPLGGGIGGGRPRVQLTGPAGVQGDRFPWRTAGFQPARGKDSEGKAGKMPAIPAGRMPAVQETSARPSRLAVWA